MSARWILAALGAVFVALLLVAAYVQGREGAAVERSDYVRAVAAAEGRAAAALARGRRADTVYRRDTVTLRRVETRYRDRVDSILRHSTDTVLRETVRTVVAAADSTIGACRSALSSCELRTAARDSAIAAQRDVIRLLRNPPPPRRLTPFAEVAYSLPDGPLARAGAGLRVWRGLSVVAAGEAWHDDGPTGRVMAGIRVTF